MEDHHTILPAHRELIQSLIDGTLDPIESHRINALLRDDIVLREFYIRQIRLDEQLHAHFEEVNSQVILSRPEPHISKRKHIISIAVSVTLGMAATIALMLVFWKGHTVPAANQADRASYSEFIPAPDRTPIARVSGVKDVVWTQSSGDLHPGQWLSAGKIELKKGLIELSYDSGSTVLIKAPAIYYIEARNKGYLEKGSIRAHSPKTVATFEIETPNSQLIDPDTEWKMLLKGKALRINSTDEIETSYTRFPADISLYDWAPPARIKRSSPPEFVHWSFDDMQNERFSETGSGSGEKSYPASLVDFSSGSDDYFWLTEGRFRKALHLDGKQRFLRTDYPGIGGNQARTIAFWIRLNPDQPDKESSPGIVAWGQNRVRGKKWQVLPFSPLLQGRQKVLRTECAHGHAMGKTNINDGEWHHVVSVFMGGEDSDIATHVKHYVDGRLENRGSMISRRVDTATTNTPEKNFPLVIGHTIQEAGASSLEQFLTLCRNGRVRFNTLNADLDELYVFNVALTPEEILRLMEENKPPE